jgi:DNA-binding CsgD family transcriptional regulator
MLAAVDLWTLGLVALSEGDLAAAESRYADATRRLRAIGFRDPGSFRFGPDHVEVSIGLGELERAEALLVDLERADATIPRPWLAAGIERGRGMLIAARGSLADGIAIVEAAAGREATAPFDRARTRYALAQLLRRANRRKDAEASLAVALETFERLGAAAWASRTRAEIARLGLRHGSDTDLTPTERRVAELTASGMTNRQVAGALFISAKTVEANLARVYRKLGIGSRAELGRAMGRSPTPEGPDLPGTYLVERYVPAGEPWGLEATIAVIAAVGSGTDVRHLGSIVIADDEVVLSLFEGPSAQAVADANERAGVPFDRISPTVRLLDGPATWTTESREENA